jgi:hypothetical protein
MPRYHIKHSGLSLTKSAHRTSYRGVLVALFVCVGGAFALDVRAACSITPSSGADSTGPVAFEYTINTDTMAYLGDAHVNVLVCGASYTSASVCSGPFADWVTVDGVYTFAQVGVNWPGLSGGVCATSLSGCKALYPSGEYCEYTLGSAPTPTPEPTPTAEPTPTPTPTPIILDFSTVTSLIAVLHEDFSFFLDLCLFVFTLLCIAGAATLGFAIANKI